MRDQLSDSIIPSEMWLDMMTSRCIAKGVQEISEIV